MATKRGAKTSAKKGAKKPAKKRSGTFRGTSDRGDFHEALQNAIAAAKVGLPSSRVIWKLQDVSGQNGGFVPENDLTVTIRAQP